MSFPKTNFYRIFKHCDVLYTWRLKVIYRCYGLDMMNPQKVPLINAKIFKGQMIELSEL